MNWQTTSGVETLQKQSTAYSTMMYCGQINNLFECFDKQKFELNDLFNEESKDGKAKFYSLAKMDKLRLGLTMNKTLFDAIFEEYYEGMYNEAIEKYEDETLKDVEIKINRNTISDIFG